MQTETTRVKKRTKFWGGVVVCLLAVYYLVPAQFFRPFQTGLVTVLMPFENFFSWVAFEIRDTRELFSSLRMLKTENEQLHQQVLSLIGSEAELRVLKRENEELRLAQGLAIRPGVTLLTGEVVARGEGGMATTLRINRGTDQGVRTGMPVVTAGNILIGRIQSVAPYAAEVRLLSHHESLIAAMADDVPGQMIVRGDHGVGLLLDLARPTDTLTPGTEIMTSGLSDGFPAGLLIGTVQSVRPSPDQLFQQATLVPPVRADTLHFVKVMTSF